MDKITEEEEFKGLEEEIDDAVDRLFVENKRGTANAFSKEPLPPEPSLSLPPSEPSMRPSAPEPSLKPPTLEPFMEPPTLRPPMKPSVEEPFMESTILEPSLKPPVLEPSIKTSLLEPSHEFESEKSLNLDNSSHPNSPRPPSAAVPISKSVENMEAQLLSLEWEITEEKLKKTREEVLALRELVKQRPDMASILNYMDKVVSSMIKSEENIRPPWIKFLLDSKETLKLLMRKETEGEITIYKQLAHHGIEARFACLDGMKEAKIVQSSPGKVEAVGDAELPISGEKKIEDMSNRMNAFMEKAEEIFRTIKQQMTKLEESPQRLPPPTVQVRSKPFDVTIFKVEKKLFGVESEKVFKVFRVPTTLLEKYPNQQKIRLRDLEVKMIDLKKMFSIVSGGRSEEIRILTVKENGEYKGLMVDQVLNKLSTLVEEKAGIGEYFSGVVHYTYQDQSVEIPILDLKKF